MHTAQVVLINKEGFVLGVSRKDNHHLFGLPGGKSEEIDNNDPKLTAIRECKEETGLNINNLELIFAIHKHGYMSYTYLATYEGEINYDEPHVVKWLPYEVLENGPFGSYNKNVKESLYSKNVEFQYSIDISSLTKDVKELLENTDEYSYLAKSLLINYDSFFKHYYISFDYIHEETLDINYQFDEKLLEIANNYGIKLCVDSGFYCK